MGLLFSLTGRTRRVERMEVLDIEDGPIFRFLDAMLHAARVDGRPDDEVFGFGVMGPARCRSNLTYAWKARLDQSLDQALARCVQRPAVSAHSERNGANGSGLRARAKNSPSCRDFVRGNDGA